MRAERAAPPTIWAGPGRKGPRPGRRCGIERRGKIVASCPVVPASGPPEGGSWQLLLLPGAETFTIHPEEPGADWRRPGQAAEPTSPLEAPMSRELLELVLPRLARRLNRQL